MDIERVVLRYGASEFGTFHTSNMAVVMFVCHGRKVKFELQLPESQQQLRQRWRALLLAIKAKLEVVETGISTFEEEFLAHIVVGAEDLTVYQKLTRTDQGQLLLPPVSGKNDA